MAILVMDIWMFPTAVSVRVVMGTYVVTGNNHGAGCVYKKTLRVVIKSWVHVLQVHVLHIRAAQTMETTVEPDLTVTCSPLNWMSGLLIPTHPVYKFNIPTDKLQGDYYK